MRPETTPMRSSTAFTSGARQFVVHEPFEITVSEAFSVLSFTPTTMVRSTSFSPGAEITTFFAPAARCDEAFSLLVKRPVHSSTASTFRSFQGDRSGEFSVRGVVARQMRVGLRVAEIVDGDESQVVLFPALIVGAQDVAADAAVTVDGDSNGHARLLRFSLLQYAFHGLHHIVHGETEVLEQFRAGRRLAVAVDPDHRAFEPDVLAPVVADTGFDADLGQRGNQH